METYRPADPDPSPRNTLSALSSAIFRRASKWKAFRSEISRISALLQVRFDTDSHFNG